MEVTPQPRPAPAEPPRPSLVPRLPEPALSEELRRLRTLLPAHLASSVTSGTELVRALEKGRRDGFIPTTLEGVDTLLAGGLPRGSLVELVSRRASGRFSIVLSALSAASSLGEAVALIDLGDHFDPQLAEANGVDLRRLLWVRPRNAKQAVMSAEMLAATGFQLVVVEMGLHPVRGRRAPDAAWVRLARTAESHGTSMLVSSPYPLTGTASEAVVKGCGTRAQWLGGGRSPRLLAGLTMELALEKHRHQKAGRHASVIVTASDAQSLFRKQNPRAAG
ncbi:MAG TPA: hypothetical protein VF701_14870 [Thermoanaerobaculia bacterium]